MTFKLLVSALALSLVCATPSFAAETKAPTFTPEQTQAIEALIKNYLEQNPEVIVQSVTRAEETKRKAIIDKARQTLVEHYTDITRHPVSPVAGNPQGDITVVEYFDYQCGHCKNAASSVQKLLQQDSNVRFVYKELPILSQASYTTAKAALASHKQGKYVAFHNALMAEKGGLDDDKIFAVAKTVGLNVDQLKKDMEAPEIEQEIARNISMAPQLTLQGTPGFIIGYQIVRGAIPFEEMKKVIADQRKFIADSKETKHAP